MARTDTHITLIGRTVSGYDKFGQPIYTETRTDILAMSVPVSRSSYYGSAQVGIELAYEFIINPAEYSGQITVEFDGKKLNIERTFKSSEDEMEIYCSLAIGLNGGAS